MDIDKNLKFSKLKSFADGTRVTKRIKDEGDANALQLDLEQVYEWAEKNTMEFKNLKLMMKSKPKRNLSIVSEPSLKKNM